MKKKLFRSSVNFSKVELVGMVSIGASGISLPFSNGDFKREEFESKKDWLAFGSLFGSVNDPKFYESMNMQNIIPKPEDFVEAPFRLITATVVGAGTWKCTDFSDAGVLKASYPLLEGKPLYKDHETDLDNWVGLVTGVKWSPSFTSNGQKVPAGIDGIVAIDSKTNPKIARGVLMGSVFSNSVTVEFTWEMSHEFENEWDFYEKVGTMGSDGKMIRRVAKLISNYHESSLCWLGADPFAKAYDSDGNLKNIDTGSVYAFSKETATAANIEPDFEKYSEESDLSKERLKKSHRYIINFGIDKSILPLTKQDNKQETPEGDQTKKIIGMNKKFLAFFVAAFGTALNIPEGSEPTPEEMEGLVKKLSYTSPEQAAIIKNKVALADKVVNRALEFRQAEDAKITEISLDDASAAFDTVTLVKNDELVSLRTEAAKVVGLEADALLGRAHLKAQKDEAIRLYKLAVGVEAVQPAVISLFEKADSPAIDGLLKQYTKEVTTEKFSGTCKDCGSHNFSFQSTLTKGDEDEFAPATTEVVSAESLRRKYGKSGLNIGRTTGENK